MLYSSCRTGSLVWTGNATITCILYSRYIYINPGLTGEHGVRERERVTSERVRVSPAAYKDNAKVVERWGIKELIPAGWAQCVCMCKVWAEHHYQQQQQPSTCNENEIIGIYNTARKSGWCFFARFLFGTRQLALWRGWLSGILSCLCTHEFAVSNLRTAMVTVGFFSPWLFILWLRDTTMGYTKYTYMNSIDVVLCQLVFLSFLGIQIIVLSMR